MVDGPVVEHRRAGFHARVIGSSSAADHSWAGL